jgi:hypothetical protein
MKNQPFLLSFAFFFLLSLSGLQAQNMFVKNNSGIQTAYPLATINKLTFSSGNFLINNISGVNSVFATANVRYFNFYEIILGLTSIQNPNKFFVYPNPVVDVLYLSTSNQAQPISLVEIYSLEGRLLLQQSHIDNETPQINVENLPIGLYFCKITSGITNQIIKFLKK